MMLQIDDLRFVFSRKNISFIFFLDK